MSCGVGHRCGSDLVLLWLWHRLAATALIRPLAWESLAWGVALKSKKKKKIRSAWPAPKTRILSPRPQSQEAPRKVTCTLPPSRAITSVPHTRAPPPHSPISPPTSPRPETRSHTPANSQLPPPTHMAAPAFIYWVCFAGLCQENDLLYVTFQDQCGEFQMVCAAEKSLPCVQRIQTIMCRENGTRPPICCLLTAVEYNKMK